MTDMNHLERFIFNASARIDGENTPADGSDFVLCYKLGLRL